MTRVAILTGVASAAILAGQQKRWPVCNVADCPHPATRYPRVLIDAKGARESDAPLVMVLPMAICVLHQDGFPVQDFLHPAARVRLSAALAEQGKAPADFDSARVEWARVGDADWINAGGAA